MVGRAWRGRRLIDVSASNFHFCQVFIFLKFYVRWVLGFFETDLKWVML